MAIEECFDKETYVKYPKEYLTDTETGRETKKKKQLTQSQRDALAKGRAKIKAKREAQKKDKIITEENQDRNKGEKRKKKKTIDEQLELEIEARLQKEIDDKLEAFKVIKYKYMSECKTLKDYKEYKAIMDEIDDDMIMDDELLKTYLMTNVNKYRIKKDLEVIEEKEQEEQIVKEQQIEKQEEHIAEQIEKKNVIIE